MKTQMYSFAIYDDDVGDIIWKKENLLYSELLSELENHIIFYSSEDEVVQDAQFHNDIKQWDIHSILDTFEKMDFFGGLIEINIWYPGRHRQIQIRANKSKENNNEL